MPAKLTGNNGWRRQKPSFVLSCLSSWRLGVLAVQHYVLYSALMVT